MAVLVFMFSKSFDFFFIFNKFSNPSSSKDEMGFHYPWWEHLHLNMNFLINKKAIKLEFKVPRSI
jgi:hypothetical protein